MRILERIGRVLFFLAAFGLSLLFAAKFGPGGLWRGFEPALAVTSKPQRAPYDLTRLEAVNETLKYVRKKYVDPDRVKPKQMLLSALNYIQRDVAQVLVHQDNPNEITVKVENEARTFRVDNVQGPWDVAARLREVFAFLQKHLANTDVDLRELEYAACNGMLHTLDPHSVFLSPDAYKEMNVQTSGAFGGLGIVISIRDQQLTVMRPMPGTPAGRAGLKRFDRIVKIENESTLNMPLDDAVRRLRGDPGTPVTVWIVREGEDGWTTPRAFPLTRESIKVASVDSRPLEAGIGYVKIKNFQATTTTEVESALATLKQKGAAKGLVLDLRGNPGGLLDQAVKVADLFLDEGVIVSTVGSSEGREERRAVGPGTEPPYPIVVLVDGHSASASEILAGALKNLDRALIVGQSTFGKGSVQLVFQDVTPEKAALKLTIAQYLTPGDISIQGVGVTPDVGLDPMTVDELEMDLTVQKDGLKERELFASLDNQNAAPPSKPEEMVRYQFTSAERETARELGRDTDDEFQLDFPVRLARDLAATLPPGKSRAEQLKAARPAIEKARKEELTKVAAELERLGVDWSAPPDGKGAKAEDLEIKVETTRPGDQVTAGEPIDLKVTVKNKGATPVYRLRAQTESESGYFDAKELVFGRIGPGEERSARAPLGWCQVEGRKYASTQPTPKDAKRVCKIPMDASDRSDGVTVRFEAEGTDAIATGETRPTVVALPRPVFKYSYQIVDDVAGNGDGKLQRGERASMHLTVKNVGTGRSFETQANLGNNSGDGLLLRAGRFDISNMKPGDARRVSFTFDVAKNLSEPEAVVTLTVADRDLSEVAKEKIKIPIEPPTAVASTDEVRVADADGSSLLESPKEGARAFGRVSPGIPVAVVGRVGGFDKVKLDSDRFAFIATSDLANATGKKASASLAFEDVYSHAPPELKITTSSLATREATVKIRGAATATTRIQDLYGFVGSRKFFYQSNKSASDPKSASFELEVPLKPGVNVINVVARESSDSTTRRTIIVRRDSETGALMKTPKTEDMEDWFAIPSDDSAP